MKDDSKMPLYLGCVADDFTGAGDLASFLQAGGLKTTLCNGIPAVAGNIPKDTQALVIALKSRTQKTEDAIRDSMAAFRYLKEKGARTLYLKYCSTFDSTPTGNIGPVIDAVLDAFDLPYTLLCPSLPVNGRTVRDGVLYVNGVPLAQSSMRNHPLTPMWASRLDDLMRKQGKYPCIFLDAQTLKEVQRCREIISEHAAKGRFYLCPDYVTDEDGDQIAANFEQLPFLTGGSGLGGALARRLSGTRYNLQRYREMQTGHRLLLAGSCSAMTQKQVQCYLAAKKAAIRIDPLELKTKAQTVETVWSETKKALYNGDILLYTTGSAGEQPGNAEDAALLEQTLAEVASRAVADGATKLIVAGGETSGAVMKALGFSMFSVGESVAPGVPVMTPVENNALALVLKSGNFGDEAFLTRVLEG